MNNASDFNSMRLKALDFTRATGREFGFIFKGGELVAEAEGQKDYVDFREAGYHESVVKDAIVTHTHPDGSSFSMQDIFMSAKFGAREAIVLGPDGSEYHAAHFDRDVDSYYLKAAQIWASQLARSMYNSEEFTKAETQLIVSHLLNIKVAGQDVYQYTYKLSPTVQAAWEKYERLKAAHLRNRA